MRDVWIALIKTCSISINLKERRIDAQGLGALLVVMLIAVFVGDAMLHVILRK